jgi:hypothetical protein
LSQDNDPLSSCCQNDFVVAGFPHLLIQSHILSGKCYQMSSFSEAKALELIKNSAKDFAMHNARQLSRIYPSGTRTGSSNFKPTPMWNVGCQLGVLSELK